MSLRPSTCLPRLLPTLTAIVAVALSASVAPAQPAAAPAAGSNAAPAAGLKVPPLPDGTPAEMLDFIDGLIPPKSQPRSRQEMMQYVRDVARVSVQAADAILPQVKADAPEYAKAAKLKMQSLMRLGQMGDEQASKDLESFAAALVQSPVAEVAAEAKRLVIVSEAQEMFASEKFDSAAGLVKKVADLIAADPNDLQTAGLAMQLAGALEQVPHGEAVAGQALKSFGPLLSASTNPQIRQLAEGFAGKLRLLDLPGKPMEIKGALVDGGAFDPKSLAGKVVLVDFWATWCGPCVAELPNILAQYEKYHARGFEVVGISLDQDREALTSFIAEKKIPWPILHEKGGEHPLATFYGITGIPQLILIGRDGNVITLNARGEKLTERLAALFKDAG